MKIRIKPSRGRKMIKYENPISCNTLQLNSATDFCGNSSEEKAICHNPGLSNDIEKSILTRNTESACVLRRALLERFALDQFTAQESDERP